MSNDALPGHLEFKHPKLFQFSGHEFYTSKTPMKPTAQTPSPSAVFNRRRTVGIVALSFDRAWSKYRELHPNMRVDAVQTSDISIDYIVDDPVVSRVAEKLEA